MNNRPSTTGNEMIRPPSLIQALTGGFNTLTANIGLILLPVAMDLLLWFGPHVRVKNLIGPVFSDLMGVLRSTMSSDMRPALDNLDKMWSLGLDQYNLLVSLVTFPVGVPSMMAGEMPTRTPLGAPLIMEAGSAGQVILGWLALSLVGLLLGSIYFALIARSVRRAEAITPLAQMDCENPLMQGLRTPEFKAGVIGWQTLQVLLLIIILILIVLVMMVPAVFLAAFLALISQALAQFALVVISLGVMWFLIPLVFSPHGIFLCGQSAFNALFTSARMVRFSLPSTGIFLLACVVLYQGMNILWSAAPLDSWMALIGVFGHAFIITGLLAASFAYYRGGLAYIQALRKLALMNSQKA